MRKALCNRADNTMQDYPHHYNVIATAGPGGGVNITGNDLIVIDSAPPKEFGGPGDKWSPETLLVASVADCFILSFRSIAKASKLPWVSLQCEVNGTLEHKEGTTKFTKFDIHAKLYVPEDANEDRAHHLLEKAEKTCLITNSLLSTIHLDAVVLKEP